MKEERLCECGCGEPTALATITNKRCGWIKGQPVRFRRGHNRRGNGRYADLSHFVLRKHERLETPCRIWQGYTNGNYGTLYVAGKTLYAHRLAYETTYGPIPIGMCVCHECDEMLCINPEHLFIGTQADNMADKVSKGRQVKGDEHWARKNPDAIRGEKNGASKLSEPQVRKIKGLLRDSRLSHGEIATRFGVVRSTISAIATGGNWSFVEEEHLDEAS